MGVLAGLGLGLAAAGNPAAAKLCGDSVDGQDVPCACGDVLVSNLQLTDDPVASEVCAEDGLIVRAPDARRGLVIDLRGATLRGSGRSGGSGIRVIAGGPGGARIVSSGGVATISGYDDGITARGSDTVALIEDLVVADSARDAVRITGRDFEIRRVEARRARRDGFGLGGSGFLITDTRAADCGRFGYFVMGDTGTIGRSGAGNLAERSGNSGFNIMGAGHTLAECAAREGRKDGVFLQAIGLDVRSCRAEANQGTGIAGMGSTWRLADNVALDNAGDGIAVRGTGLTDEGGNRGEKNRGGERPTAVQCAINGTACAS
ncbi:MAG: right-handed parallel beta-helix repeat-containing protein [Candidatus Binatia bacterium]